MDVSIRCDVDDAGRRDRRPAREAGRQPAPVLMAAVALGGLLLLAGCGGGDDCPSCPRDGSAEPLDLSVGEVVVREADGQTLRLELPADRVHDVAAQADRRSVGNTSMRLAVETNSGAGGSVTSSGAVAPIRDRAAASERWTRSFDLAVRLKIQESARRLLRDRNVRPARPGARSAGSSPGPRFSSMLPNSTPSEGDTLEFWYPVQEDFSISCDTDSAEVVTGEVRAVGQRAIMVQDTSVNESILQDPMNYDSLAQAFDDEVFGTDVAYFGETTDIDGNGRTYVLFTTKVNELTDPDDEGLVTGFFLPTDLADSGDPDKDGSENVSTCEASNEAEALYLVAPDPDGEHGKVVSVERAKRSAGGTSAHEFQHLLNAANRVIKQSGTFNDLEDTWLDEGLSHLAEEVVGLGLTGDPIRSNLTLADVAEDSSEVEVFNTFHIPNFARLSEYMQGPATPQVLAVRDPQGLESLKMRGFVWAFVRWLADQEATASAAPVPGSGEEDLFRELAKANGGLDTGVGNVEAVTGRTWSVLLEDFGLVVAVDDTVPGVEVRKTLPTWNLPVMYRQLHENTDPGPDSPFREEYPLSVTENAFSPDTLDFEVQGGTQKYLRFDGSGASSSVVVELSDQSGSPLAASSGARLLIVRTR